MHAKTGSDSFNPAAANWSELERLWFRVGYHTALDESGKIVDLLQEILRLNPFSAAAYMHLGVRLRDQKDVETALAYLACAVELDKDNADAAFHYGTCLAMAGENQKAHNWLLRATEMSPGSVGYLVNLGMNFLTLGEEFKAMKCFENVLSLSPDNLPALYNLGFFYKKNGNLGLARDFFTRLIRANPSFISAHQMLMRVFLQMNSTREAISTIDAALSGNPDEYELILDKLALNSIFKRKAEIREEVAKIEKLVPDCSEQLAERVRSLSTELKSCHVLLQ